jgi:hypothetical protein
MTALTLFPDVESALMFALLPEFPEYRFCTILPAGDPTKIISRITRTTGTNKRIWVDEPTVEIDTWGFRSNIMDVSIAAREIQAFLLGLMGVQVTNGVIQHITTINGPRPIPEANQTLYRYNASYEVRLHP